MRKYLYWAGSVLPLILFYFLGVNHIEPSEVGIARNQVTGKLELQQKAGWWVTPPWVRVARIDLRPMRVGVYSAGRGFSTKLVRFDPRHYQEFIETEGFRYYWWDNRLSFNIGHSEEHRGLRDILRGYAYSAKRYPFVVTVEEYQSR